MAYASYLGSTTRYSSAALAILLNVGVLFALAVVISTVKIPPPPHILHIRPIPEPPVEQPNDIVEPTIKTVPILEPELKPLSFESSESGSNAIHDARWPRSDSRHPNSRPEYPRTSILLREEGTVVLAVLVDVDGRVTDARIEDSSGYARLDDSALRAALSGYRYLPGRNNGAPTPMWLKIRIVFRLDESGTY